jgi:predicted small lipoprotein YifL
MKRILSLLLAVIMLLSMTGCGGSEAPETQPAPAETVAPETTVPETTVPETTVPETTVPVYEGDLFLTVSSINFSLVGESEDIYVGTAPREEITWTSADESVITVENGVLTAVGVGTTTVSAAYGDQYMECTAGCLAETEEGLIALGYDVIRQPKRLPPVFDDELITYFDDAAIVGDSISYIMYQWEAKYNLLHDALFLVRGGCSINGFVRKYKLIYYQGVETPVEDALALAGVNKVFIMLGQNDLSYMTIEDTMANYKTMVDRIREKSPDIQIYLQSCVPEWFKNGANNEKNEKIDEFNVQLEAYCAENDIYFVDLAPYAEDHANMMPTPYSMDYGIHLNEAGCVEWMRVLRAYAKLQTLKGEE